MLDEFLLMKYSFELFHGDALRWSVRCDASSHQTLRSIANISCTVFGRKLPSAHIELGSPHWVEVVQQKMGAMDDAWTPPHIEGVIYVDADLIFTANILDDLLVRKEDLRLSPNFYPESRKYLIPTHGYYNSGFIFSRARRFCSYWKHAATLNASPWSEQASLNGARQHFTTSECEKFANIGWWRSVAFPIYDEIPPECQFLHVHLFQPLGTPKRLLDKTYALHCVNFLNDSGSDPHHILLNQILNRDHSGWYKASLTLTR